MVTQQFTNDTEGVWKYVVFVWWCGFAFSFFMHYVFWFTKPGRLAKWWSGQL